MQAWHSRPIRLSTVPAPTGATNFSNLRSINVCHQLRRPANVARRFGTKRFVKVGPILAFDTLIQWQRWLYDRHWHRSTGTVAQANANAWSIFPQQVSDPRLFLTMATVALLPSGGRTMCAKVVHRLEQA
jgi:hypothetical protein